MRSLMCCVLGWLALGATARGDEAGLKDYLDRDMPAMLQRVSVDDAHVRIHGQAPAGTDLWIAETPLFAAVPVAPFVSLDPITTNAGGQFEVRLDRQVQREGHTWDRLFSRWCIVRKTAEGEELLSHARYADEVQPLREIAAEKPRNRKGLGGFTLGRPLSDIDDLGVSAVTVNVTIQNLLHREPGDRRTPFEFGGQTWYANDRAVARLDATFTEAARRKLVVSAIILIPPAGTFSDPELGRLVAHPDATSEGIYVMPNLTTAEGTLAYAAHLHFLVERYTRPESPHGRIHHWILHNEVNSGWVWTNAGEKSLLEYVDLFHKSLRLTQLLVRRYDAHGQVFVSLDHHWRTRHNQHCYPARDILEALLRFSRAEGDFDWAIAHHPYPQDLGNPRVWEDDQPTFAFDTPKITFRNLEVLDAWVKLPEARYLGERQRTVHLTEQGLNSRDYSEASLRDQAAGMAYTWNKIKWLDSIEVFHYHNWVDHPDEGGLRIGLRRFPNDAEDPQGKKPIWEVYRAVGTPDEDGATEFAKPLIGIQDWSEILDTGEIR